MKTNKTKPIKKIMIFTIITVMIVSLFAVPAFADEPQVTNLIGTTWRLDDDSVNGLPANYGTFGIVADVTAYSTPALNREPQSFISDTFNCGSEQNVLSISGNYESTTIIITIPLIYDGINYLDYAEVTFTGGDDISNPLFIDFINTYGTLVTDEEPPADGEEQGIFAVWSKITQWIVQGLASVSNAFYADGKLTLLGTLCIIPLALGLACLLIGIIQKFLRLRG